MQSAKIAVSFSNSGLRKAVPFSCEKLSTFARRVLAPPPTKEQSIPFDETLEALLISPMASHLSNMTSGNKMQNTEPIQIFAMSRLKRRPSPSIDAIAYFFSFCFSRIVLVRRDFSTKFSHVRTEQRTHKQARTENKSYEKRGEEGNAKRVKRQKKKQLAATFSSHEHTTYMTQTSQGGGAIKLSRFRAAGRTMHNRRPLPEEGR